MITVYILWSIVGERRMLGVYATQDAACRGARAFGTEVFWRSTSAGNAYGTLAGELHPTFLCKPERVIS